MNAARLVAIIPARGGSRRVPRKNVRLTGGKPLIAWTIEAAKKAASVDRVVVTTDDAEIAAVANEYGAEVPFVRPPHLSTDTATSADVVTHVIEALALNALPNASFVLLQPTSPLRTAGDIDAAALLPRSREAVVSVTPLAEPVQWLRTIDAEGRMRRWLERDPDDGRAEQLYHLNGAIYMMRIARFLDNRELIPSDAIAYVMPPERSLDVDTEFDLRFCDFLLTTR